MELEAWYSVVSRLDSRGKYGRSMGINIFWINEQLYFNWESFTRTDQKIVGTEKLKRIEPE